METTIMGKSTTNGSSVVQTYKATFTLAGKSKYMFGRPVGEPKMNEETGEQYEGRTWIHRLNRDEGGFLAVPGMAIQKSLIWSGGWLGLKIPGQRGKTYKARFISGVTPLKGSFRFIVKAGADVKDLPAIPDDNMVDEFLKVGFKLPLFVPADPSKPKGSRVWRFYPCLRAGWLLQGEMLVVDNMITKDVFYRHLTTAGMFDGLGSMRVSTGNGNGMYLVEDFAFEPFELA